MFWYLWDPFGTNPRRSVFTLATWTRCWLGNWHVLREVHSSGHHWQCEATVSMADDAQLWVVAVEPLCVLQVTLTMQLATVRFLQDVGSVSMRTAKFVPASKTKPIEFRQTFASRCLWVPALRQFSYFHCNSEKPVWFLFWRWTIALCVSRGPLSLSCTMWPSAHFTPGL